MSDNLQETYLQSSVRNLIEASFDTGESKAWWLGPRGDLISMGLGDDKFHVVYLMKHPATFGIPQKAVDDVIANYGHTHNYHQKIPIDLRFVDIDGANDLMELAYDNGWIRIDYAYAAWGITVSKLDSLHEVALEVFANKIINHKYDSVEGRLCLGNLTVKIFPLLHTQDDRELTMQQMADGYLED